MQATGTDLQNFVRPLESRHSPNRFLSQATRQCSNLSFGSKHHFTHMKNIKCSFHCNLSNKTEREVASKLLDKVGTKLGFCHGHFVAINSYLYDDNTLIDFIIDKISKIDFSVSHLFCETAEREMVLFVFGPEEPNRRDAEKLFYDLNIWYEKHAKELLNVIFLGECYPTYSETVGELKIQMMR